MLWLGLFEGGGDWDDEGRVRRTEEEERVH